jgi:hypothetical protein
VTSSHDSDLTVSQTVTEPQASLPERHGQQGPGLPCAG